MGWAEDLFIEKAELFLKVMNERWEIAKLEVMALEKIFLRFGFRRGKVLDVMCGNGRIAINLAKKGYDVVGIDFSELFIKDAQAKAEAHKVLDKVKFLQVDVRKSYDLLKSIAPFDIILIFWTSIGFYGEETDLAMFKNLRELVHEHSILVIADTISKENLLAEFNPSTYAEFNDLLVLHKAEFDTLTSILDDLWRFYKKKGKTLEFIDVVRVRLRVYSLSELRSMLLRSGWSVIAAYDSIFSLEPIKKDSNINFVAKPIQSNKDDLDEMI